MLPGLVVCVEGSVDGGEGLSQLLPRPPGPTPLLPSLAGPLAHQGGGPTPAWPEGGWVGVINSPPPGPLGCLESALKIKKEINKVNRSSSISTYVYIPKYLNCKYIYIKENFLISLKYII